MNCFYAEGLHFECQGCQYCCGVEPGYVFLTEKDLKAMSSYFKMSNEAFIKEYCVKVDMGAFYMVSIKEKDNYDCIFLSDKGCSIYPVRPLQCRNYPFWSNIMISKEEWQKESSFCPGIGKGKLYSKKEIEGFLEEKRKNPSILLPKKV